MKNILFVLATILFLVTAQAADNKAPETPETPEVTLNATPVEGTGTAVEGTGTAVSVPQTDAEASPASTEAPTTPETVDEAVAQGGLLIKAVKSRNWPLAVGLALTLLVFIANKLGLKNLVGKKALPWIVMALATLGTVGAGLVGGVSILDALLQGVLAGVTAIGGWELLLKHLTGKVETSPVPTA